MKIEKKSATRVDLSGGTLDLWPLHLLVGDCVTVNMAITISTYATLEEKAGRAIEIHMRDQNYRKTFADLADFLNAPEPELNLLQKHVAFWKPEQGFALETFSESPIGGGLGGSSSLSVSLIKAFAEWRRKDLDLYQAVNLAHNIEAQVLHKMTGTQDYFPAFVPGLNAIHYTAEGARLENLKADSDTWNGHTSLVYTGQPHHSGLNNWEVVKHSLDGEKGTLRALNDIREISWEIYHAVKAGAYGGIAKLFDREFDARVRLSSSFSSPEIDRLREVALRSGAEAVKICGAGGGGCVLVWSNPSAKQKVEAGCRENGFQTLSAKAVL